MHQSFTVVPHSSDSYHCSCIAIQLATITTHMHTRACAGVLSTAPSQACVSTKTSAPAGYTHRHAHPHTRIPSVHVYTCVHMRTWRTRMHACVCGACAHTHRSTCVKRHFYEDYIPALCGLHLDYILVTFTFDIAFLPFGRDESVVRSPEARYILIRI